VTQTSPAAEAEHLWGLEHVEEPGTKHPATQAASGSEPTVREERDRGEQLHVLCARAIALGDVLMVDDLDRPRCLVVGAREVLDHAGHHPLVEGVVDMDHERLGRKLELAGIAEQRDDLSCGVEPRPAQVLDGGFVKLPSELDTYHTAEAVLRRDQ
jgi:hypothetical protein